jgi:hypothetical protein
MLPSLTLRKGLGSLALGSLLFSCPSARAADPDPPLTKQLNDLGRQALAQGHADDARTFFRKVLAFDPADATARRALDSIPGVRRVAFQPPAVDPAAAAAA